jgi:amino acid transporter
MWEALEQTAWVKTLGSTGWLYASVSIVHYVTMFWFIGSIAIVDLRVMGIAARERNVVELGEQLFPWAWMGFTLSVIAGFLEFATAAGDWAPDPVFHVKLALIVLSVIFTIIVQTGVKKWAQAPKIPTAAKIVALISLLLWIVTIVASSEIPALEGLG